MAKLTAEQKEANKDAAKERRAAFNARRKAYRAALAEAARRVFEAPEGAEADVALAELDRAIEQRAAALADIDAQLAKLQTMRVEVEAQNREIIDRAKCRRDAAWLAQKTIEKALVDKVNASYPDMVNCHSASQWLRPEGP